MNSNYTPEKILGMIMNNYLNLKHYTFIIIEKWTKKYYKKNKAKYEDHVDMTDFCNNLAKNTKTTKAKSRRKNSGEASGN